MTFYKKVDTLDTDDIVWSMFRYAYNNQMQKEHHFYVLFKIQIYTNKQKDMYKITKVLSILNAASL
jgi:hypothetical protein